jgi:uncharacterized protein
MTVAQSSGLTAELTTLLEGLVNRVAHAERGIVLSNDGLLVASSHGLSREEAEHLAAVASGFQSLARGTGHYLGGGDVRQTIIELEKGFFFITAAGPGACLAVHAGADADMGLIAYEMARLVPSLQETLGHSLRVGVGRGAHRGSGAPGIYERG